VSIEAKKYGKKKQRMADFTEGGGKSQDGKKMETRGGKRELTLCLEKTLSVSKKTRRGKKSVAARR